MLRQAQVFVFGGLCLWLLGSCGPEAPCLDDSQDTAGSGNPEGWKQVASGFAHACGLRNSGVVDCWGFNEFGQADAPEVLFESIDAGMHHS